MRKLNSFMFISLDGYYKAPNEDISWHRHGQEEGDFSAQSLQSQDTLLFGRVTYQMMESFWPTPMALESMPAVAEGMNAAEKIVFSRTMDWARWNNTRIINGNLIEEVRLLKQQPGNNLTLLGSGSILGQLASEGLIDSYQIMIDPVALGSGASIFKNIKQHLNLKLTDTKAFKSGVILLSYEPA